MHVRLIMKVISVGAYRSPMQLFRRTIIFNLVLFQGPETIWKLEINVKAKRYLNKIL